MYYTTTAELDRRSRSGTGSGSTDPWFESDSVDPADLHGVWASRAEGRECMLDFRPDGKLIWTTRTTVVGKAKTLELVACHDYQFERGRFLVTTLTEQLADGKATVPEAARRAPKLWKLDWKADDKSTFQLRSDPEDKGRPHLLFRRSPPDDEK